LKKKWLPVVKIQNGGCIQDGVENIFIILKIFNIFQKIQDFIAAQPQNEMFSFLWYKKTIHFR
jgi:hypothetical protein